MDNKLKYQYLFFDLDGLLVDTGEGIFDAVSYALSKFGRTLPESDKHSYMGPPLSLSFVKFGGIPKEDTEKAVSFFRERYDSCFIEKSRVYDGIPEMLAKLRALGFSLCVATSKLESSAVLLLGALGISEFFDFISGSNKEGTILTKSQVIVESLRRFSVTDKSKVLMIGDRFYDDTGAAALGIDSLGVYMGYAEENEHENACATYIARGVGGMSDILYSFASEGV